MEPKISVITVTLNNKNGLERTISCIKDQTFKCFEFLVIDGGSIDGTKELLEKNSQCIDWSISSKDNGIYDAMNRGISVARGDWIIFLNSSDIFYSSDTLEVINEYLINNELDVIYGDVIAIDNDAGLESLVKSIPLNEIWKGMCFSHQSCFVRRELLLKYQFNNRYLISADYYLILTLIKNYCKFKYIPMPISKTQINGRSYSNPLTYIEIKKAYEELFDKKHSTFHNSRIFLTYFNKGIMNIIGEKGTSIVRKFKWMITLRLVKREPLF